VRSGTLNVPGIVGLARAAELVCGEMEPERLRLATLRDRFEGSLMDTVAGVTRNGDAQQRLAGTSNISIAGVDAESLMRRMPGIAASSSSACTSASLQPSHVLGALGLSREAIDGSLRFSLGRGTNHAHLDLAVDRISAAVDRERAEGSLPACGN
jgi:cysteine desulfurase